ncbi:hypothetical protein Taro_043786 [Colocasia esculenta]|uniref:Retrotransposon gag domain-containing protein n=1 Tax=Colocasia esculenta TaxID=4460 RepID=A0A843X1C9_COLES|nr:hypothetical protein [Colocasia esculenta]
MAALGGGGSTPPPFSPACCCSRTISHCCTGSSRCTSCCRWFPFYPEWTSSSWTSLCFLPFCGSGRTSPICLGYAQNNLTWCLVCSPSPSLAHPNSSGVFLCVSTDLCVVSLARLRPVRGRRTWVKHITSLMDLGEAFRHSWYQSKEVEMADRREWGGGGEDPEESSQRMIERIWESLTDIQMRMDQQTSVPPVIGEAVPVAPVPPPPGVEVPIMPSIPPPPVMVAEEPVLQVEKFLRLQPPTYTGGPNPDTAEHWIHEIERVFTTMRCPAVDKVVLATYQLWGFALEWWRLKMQTTFAGRTEEIITWPEFLDVFNDTFFPIQVQQVKREQFQTLQQVEEAAQRAATLERSIRTRQTGESDSDSFRLPQQSVGVSKGKAPAGPSSSGFGKWGQKLKQAFKGKGRGWGSRQQFQHGPGKPEVEESQQSTARQPTIPPSYRCFNYNQSGHLIRNCP